MHEPDMRKMGEVGFGFEYFRKKNGMAGLGERNWYPLDRNGTCDTVLPRGDLLSE